MYSVCECPFYGTLGINGLIDMLNVYFDRYMENTARNELFKSGNIMFDLASLNIKRGREWGTPSYTKFRTLCGLADGVTDWAWSDFTDHSDTARAALEDVYEYV